jgi:EAL domain-containing protein (putative c-di-GMP-specific phosphodiesterase class I)
MTVNPTAAPEIRTTRWILSGQVSDSDPLRQVLINQSPLTVGRSPNSKLTLPVSCVSGNHAAFHLEGDDLFLEDLNSTNGTYINGDKVSEKTLIHAGDIIQFATIVFRVSKADTASVNNTVHEDSGDRALAMIQFDRLINDGNMFPYFQPIVHLADESFFGYEVLGRSRLFGLQMPGQMFHAASQLNLEAELSEVFRTRGIEVGQRFGHQANLFLNTHPKELGHDRLYDSLQELRKISSEQVITLEIHEAAVTNLTMMRKLTAVLRDLDIKLAFDDFGVGQARLVELAEIRPDFLKFDMKLTQNINKAGERHQKVVSLFAKMVNELGITTLAEGVETKECHELLLEMGFSAGQGYYYGRPLPIAKYLNIPVDANLNDTKETLAE